MPLVPRESGDNLGCFSGATMNSQTTEGPYDLIKFD